MDGAQALSLWRPLQVPGFLAKLLWEGQASSVRIRALRLPLVCATILLNPLSPKISGIPCQP